jgi:hypothetical protein
MLAKASTPRAITGRHLLRFQAEPRGEVTPFRKSSANAENLVVRFNQFERI